MVYPSSDLSIEILLVNTHVINLKTARENRLINTFGSSPRASYCRIENQIVRFVKWPRLNISITAFEREVKFIINKKIHFVFCPFHRINREFRDVDRPTDVLSFPQADLTAGSFDPEMAEFDYDTGRYNLGDMAVSVDKIREQAEEYGNTVLYELSYLTVHSCLHLLCYDHLDEGEQKKQMRTREKEIMTLKT